MKYLILGAGPAGLSVANSFLQHGIQSFVVLESEEEAGGLCRSKIIDGFPIDIGGGHFLDVRRPKVNEFLFQYMPRDEWNHFVRDSRIQIDGVQIGHPFEANIWQFDLDSQVEYLKSIANAGCNLGTDEPTNFVDWIYWKLGDKIADDYMIPYNTKMFGEDLNDLGTYWLEKLPNVSFEDTLKSCIMRKAFAQQPGHAEFYYPKKHGYGELWMRMADSLGDRIIYNSKVEEVDFKNKIVVTSNGDKYQADVIITTIPWTSIGKIKGMPYEIESDIAKLRHSSIQIQFYRENMDTEAHWIYFPDLKLEYHRILVRSNFCFGSNGYWTETNTNRIKRSCKAIDDFFYVNEYAYPINSNDKPQVMNRLLLWCREHDVYGLGRWGEHSHYNSDLTVELALKLADQFVS